MGWPICLQTQQRFALKGWQCPSLWGVVARAATAPFAFNRATPRHGHNVTYGKDAHQGLSLYAFGTVYRVSASGLLRLKDKADLQAGQPLAALSTARTGI
eukprot:6177618-Pleurochrysis_carterae.AAC.5